MRRVIVIGGGAAGLFAAGTAARHGAAVTLLEKKNKPGRKISITGKGRCNVTTAVEKDEIIRHYPRNGKFLYSALEQFSNQDLMNFMEAHGVPLKVERGQRVFPVSDQAEDVVSALVSWVRKKGVALVLDAEVQRIEKTRRHTFNVVYTGGSAEADAVILATGGLSYPGTGSTGDGYRFAAELGHTITNLRPGLIPLITEESWVPELQGLSLKNIKLTSFKENGKKINEEFGEMLFTHFGVSGPIVLSMSRDIGEEIFKKHKPVRLKLDLKPALTEETLDARLQRELAAAPKKQFKNILSGLLPAKLIPVFIKLGNIPAEKECSSITREERLAVVALLKNICFTAVDLRPVKEAIVTSGGVKVKEVDPKTMESKVTPGLYIAGELLDVDGYTGGFNLQAAFSTGYTAGLHAAAEAEA